MQGLKVKDTELEIAQGDITELEVDAIVNAANNKLVMGGGVAGAIKRKGGKIIEEEAVKKGPIEIGEAVATSAGSLRAKYIIHAATMGMDFLTDEVKVRDSSRNALRVAEELRVGSVAFPALGCGVGGFPLVASAKIMSQEILKHLRQRDKTSLKKIFLCLYDKEAFEVFNKVVAGYINYITNKLQRGPFTTVDAIIEIDGGIVVIERTNPPFGWALPGGFVDCGESLEDAITREAKEETDLVLVGLKQFHTYSAPGRDPRFHTIATVFVAKGRGRPKAGDDAGSLKIVRLNEIEKMNFAFDHKKIIEDYINHIGRHETPSPRRGEGWGEGDRTQFGQQ